MDGARITGPQIAWNKAFTAAGHKRSTHLFNRAPNGPALPGNEAFGIQWSFDGRFAVFVGGFPIVVDGAVVGGVGLSGGNGEQDTAAGWPRWRHCGRRWRAATRSPSRRISSCDARPLRQSEMIRGRSAPSVRTAWFLIVSQSLGKDE